MGVVEDVAKIVGAAVSAVQCRLRLKVELGPVEGRGDGCWWIIISNHGRCPVTFAQMDWSIGSRWRRRCQYVGIQTYIQYHTQSLTVPPGRTLEASFFATALPHRLKSLPGKLADLHGRIHTADGRYFLFYPGDELICVVRGLLGDSDSA